MKKWILKVMHAPWVHIYRRMNVRDSRVSRIMNRRLIIRRGGTYGPYLPDDAPEDGANRGIAVFAGCADLPRQFEFLISVWANDPEFMELNEKDPFAGSRMEHLR